MKPLSLLELTEHLNRVVALNYPETIWLTAEIAQANLNRGHWYISLIDKGNTEGQVAAKATAIIWKNTNFKTFDGDLKLFIREGNTVLLKVSVRYHSTSGLQLIIEDIDKNYTIGEWQRKKEELANLLKKEGIWNENRKLMLPSVIQRLAILSSETAAGLKDFLHQLTENPNHLKYHPTLFSTLVQGEAAPAELEQAIRQVALHKEMYDVLVIVRGGGAKADLMAFDEERVVRAILEVGVPVITGIGHDIDQTLSDLVANQALKTPTAVAEFLHAHNLKFLYKLNEIAIQLADSTQKQLKVKELNLIQIRNQVFSTYEKTILRHQLRLQDIRHRIALSVQQLFLEKEKELFQIQQNIQLKDIKKQLENGSVLITKEDTLVKSALYVKAGDTLKIRWKDGEKEVKVL